MAVLWDRDQATAPGLDLPVRGGPETQFTALTRGGLFSLLREGVKGAGATAARGVFLLALQCLVKHLKEDAGDKLPRVLVGTPDDTLTNDCQQQHSNKRPGEDPCETYYVRTVRALIRHGTGRSVSLDSREACVRYVQTSFDRVLLPYVSTTGQVLCSM